MGVGPSVGARLALSGYLFKVMSATILIDVYVNVNLHYADNVGNPAAQAGQWFKR
jgi:hypothetical protein